MVNKMLGCVIGIIMAASVAKAADPSLVELGLVKFKGDNIVAQFEVSEPGKIPSLPVKVSFLTVKDQAAFAACMKIGLDKAPNRAAGDLPLTMYYSKELDDYIESYNKGSFYKKTELRRSDAVCTLVKYKHTPIKAAVFELISDTPLKEEGVNKMYHCVHFIIHGKEAFVVHVMALDPITAKEGLWLNFIETAKFSIIE